MLQLPTAVAIAVTAADAEAGAQIPVATDEIGYVDVLSVTVKSGCC